MSSPEQVASVVRRHAPFVWRVLRQLGAPEGQLEDLSQEVFLVILRRLDDFEGRSALSTWIYGICRNVALRARREAGRRRELPMSDPPEGAVPETQTRTLSRRQALSHMHTALQSLGEPTRMVFVLYEIEKMPMAEVAATLGCNPSTAYSRLYAARAHVLAVLTHEGLADQVAEIAEAT